MMHIFVVVFVVVSLVIDEPYQILRTNYQFHHLLQRACCFDRYIPFSNRCYKETVFFSRFSFDI